MPIVKVIGSSSLSIPSQGWSPGLSSLWSSPAAVAVRLLSPHFCVSFVLFFLPFLHLSLLHFSLLHFSFLVPSSFLLLVVRPGALSSVLCPLLLVARMLLLVPLPREADRKRSSCHRCDGSIGDALERPHWRSGSSGLIWWEKS